MKRRGLSEDDLALWRKVAERTEKLDLKTLFRAEIDGPHPAAPALQRAKTVISGGKSAPKTKPSAHVQPSFAAPLGPASVQMDKRAFTKLQRGKLKPEGKLDLHGFVRK